MLDRLAALVVAHPVLFSILACWLGALVLVLLVIVLAIPRAIETQHTPQPTVEPLEPRRRLNGIVELERRRKHVN